MVDRLRITFAQLNPDVGDIAGNAAQVRAAYEQARDAGADLIVFPEQFLTGYPAEDLYLKPVFQELIEVTAHELAGITASGPAILLGCPWRNKDRLMIAVLHLADGTIQDKRYKVKLAEGGVFDEPRRFESAGLQGPMDICGVPIGVPICEDIWSPQVCKYLVDNGAEILISPNGSPFDTTKQDIRLQHVAARVTENKVPLAYLNRFGGQDELVFDGASFCLNTDGSLAFQLPAFDGAVTSTDWVRDHEGWRCESGERALYPESQEAAYSAALLGVRDYVNKNRFPGVVLGLSGGIDSALCAALAVDALGADHVQCLMMPSQFTTAASLRDAKACAEALGAGYDIVGIEGSVAALEASLADLFAGRSRGVTEENLQSRVRGTLLMAVSNKFGSMVISTGNKSEMAVGYATLYGDMNGGFNPIKDLYKTEVFALARWRNEHAPLIGLGPDTEVIPEAILTKAPSAELKPDQKDEDTLPPYEVLDALLRGLVEEDVGVEELAARGHDRAVVARVEQMLYVAEYKRRQAPPGPKISPKNFGRDRRYPITSGFRDAGRDTKK